MNKALFIAELTADEGLRLFVYDDATGLPIKPGSVVKGHPTIGIGRALDTHGITGAEAQFLLADDEADIEAALAKYLPYWGILDDARKRVLANMAFELGTRGLLGFVRTLNAVAVGDFAGAAIDLLQSAWAKQVPARAQRLAKLMAEGDPTA